VDHHGSSTIVARYPHTRGSLALRGNGASLDWFHDRAPAHVDGDTSTFELDIPHGESVEVKLVRSDGAWMVGRNAVVACGDRLELSPAFDRVGGTLLPPRTIDVEGYGPLTFRTFLPPSYDEQIHRRYPVLYAQDGQSVWGDGTDPYGVWGLERVIDELWDLGALDEIIIVSIDTGDRRLERLGPVPDRNHGGGLGAAHLEVVAGTLKPLIDTELRTRSDRASTALLGASMGGLFSFWAAWVRPDLFGAAICLSSSFWWNDRWLVREVQRGVCPHPRPRLYLDSGAAASGFEEDASTRDGVHHTRAMYRALIGHCYALREDLHVLSFAGHHHHAPSWTARVAIPLQMLFPRSA
jgi:predicted alpha/beta superfamily hydrolase